MRHTSCTHNTAYASKHTFNAHPFSFTTPTRRRRRQRPGVTEETAKTRIHSSATRTRGGLHTIKSSTHTHTHVMFVYAVLCGGKVRDTALVAWHPAVAYILARALHAPKEEGRTTKKRVLWRPDCEYEQQRYHFRATFYLGGVWGWGWLRKRACHVFCGGGCPPSIIVSQSTPNMMGDVSRKRGGGREPNHASWRSHAV